MGQIGRTDGQKVRGEKAFIRGREVGFKDEVVGAGRVKHILF